LDPLDGSGNADASICTGTIFGVFEKAPNATDLVESILQPAQHMRAAGYCLYSSATVLVFTLGQSVQGFTLDPQRQEFVLSHTNLTIPRRGNVYSCNEANSEGWDDSYRAYLKALKTGTGETRQRYAHRYVGSMVADIHRTLLYGGIFAYPADTLDHPHGNLQLLYKVAPLARIVHQAGGRAMDGRTGDLLQVRPERVHQKSPCYMGSWDDVTECESYLQRVNHRHHSATPSPKTTVAP
jgi:fructose-1,6-bisphosphatase I